MSDVFKATPCMMNGEAGYHVRQVRPDGSIATESWTDTLKDLQDLGLQIEIIEENGSFGPLKRG
jgi:hypothetical protein